MECNYKYFDLLFLNTWSKGWMHVGLLMTIESVPASFYLNAGNKN